MNFNNKRRKNNSSQNTAPSGSQSDDKWSPPPNPQPTGRDSPEMIFDLELDEEEPPQPTPSSSAGPSGTRLLYPLGQLAGVPPHKIVLDPAKKKPEPLENKEKPKKKYPLSLAGWYYTSKYRKDRESKP